MALHVLLWLPRQIYQASPGFVQSITKCCESKWLTDWFSTKVGVRQGCIISPHLFNILLEVVMLYALHDSNTGACMNGRVINNLRFADDIVLLAESERDLQTLVSDVFKSSLQLGLRISLSKTQVQVIGKNSTKINTPNCKPHSGTS